MFPVFAQTKDWGDAPGIVSVSVETQGWRDSMEDAMINQVIIN